MPVSDDPGARTTSASPRLRLQRMSRWMRAFVALGAIALLSATIALWTDAEGPLRLHVRELLTAAGIAQDAPLSAATLRMLLLIALPGMLLALFAMLHVWRLFGAYGRGQVFGPIAVRHIRFIAWTVIASSLWHMLSRTLGILLLTWHNPPGQRQLNLGVSWEDYLGILFGGLLLAMAWAMTEAARIEQDNAGFV